MKEHAGNNFIFASLFGNPVDMVRIASLMLLDGKEIFGAAGAALTSSPGGETAGICLQVAALVIWIVIPILISQRILKRQDI